MIISSFSKNFILCLFLVGIFSLPIIAQTQPAKDNRISSEPLDLIETPTAGILYHRNLFTTLEFFERGGIVAGFHTGLFNRITLGVSYGGTEILGNQKASFNPMIGFALRVRLFEETFTVPAFTLGFNSQGKGSYIDSLDRYTYKSTGLYIVASKNFSWAGYLSLHAGFHYSLEEPDNRTGNAFLGVEKTLASFGSVMAEYDISFKNISVRSVEKGNGYLNMGVRLLLGNNLSLGLNLKDIVQNEQTYSIGNRTIQLEYKGWY